MIDRSSVVSPIIHDNGTRKSRLMTAYDEAYTALQIAMEKLKLCSPNGRDYYPEVGLIAKAEKQHSKMLSSVSDAMDTIESIMMGIDEQETNDRS